MPPCLLPNYPSSCGLEHQALNLLSLSTVASCYLEQLGLYLALLPIHIFCDEFVVYPQMIFVAHPHWTNRTLSDLYDGYFQTDETVRNHLPYVKVELILIQRDISVVSEYFLSNHWFVLAAIKIPTFLSSWSLPFTPSTENLLRWDDEILKRKS